ncbi:hypothetical protein HNQ07_004325 [Deinococcus metalli]|uniref:Uncharacterized protein n=1 Tax=Deinococcus metalli TaxID=1141878 RepID=A0A7W8KKC4_9DEIO|nr:permease prefix domain 1-containing protein [Deinococcus metalli]MBB5378818.1 hypothetical protein [Deinococcus metalli]GHF60541.1 hypothetical protein GCM10017781_40930 [Deinococcus metalli]
MTSRVDTPRPAAVTAYLRRATWGLPRAQQQALWDELEEHLLSRAERLELGGLSPTHALLQATRELGSPSRVTLGMTQVYAMPKLLIAAATAALALSAALYALAGGSGGGVITLPVLTVQPVAPSCVQGVVPSGTYANVVHQGQGVTCTTPSASDAQTLSLSLDTLLSLAQALGGSVKRQPTGWYRIQLGSTTKTGWAEVPVSFQSAGKPYFYARTLFGITDPQTTVLRGYAQPALLIGGHQATFDTRRTPAGLVGQLFYNSITLPLLDFILPESVNETTFGRSVAPAQSRYTHTLSTALSPDEVVLLVTRPAATGAKTSTDYRVSIAPVGTAGTVAINSDQARLRFVSDPALLGPAAGGRLNALLVRITNIPLSALREGIITPAQANSDAR